MTATAGTDGSVSVVQAINFSAADFSPLGVADTSKASVSADGTVLTIATATYADTDEVNFTINGESFTVAVAAADAYGNNQLGLISKIQDTIDANTKLGGLQLTVAAGTATSITITASAQTTDLIQDVSTDPASATAASTGLNVATAADCFDHCHRCCD